MADPNRISQLISSAVRRLFSVKRINSFEIGEPKKILIIRQHNQFGDLLASIALFRAVKETFPKSHLTVVVSPENIIAVTKNKFIDKIFLFDKRKLYSVFYILKLKNLLRSEYDLCITPVTVSISFTSLLLGRLSNSKIRIGPNSLDGVPNRAAYLFDRRIDMDWRKHPDSHVSDFGLEIVRPFGISTNNFHSTIAYDKQDKLAARKFIRSMHWRPGQKLIGLHVGAGKPKNRWSLVKFIKLMTELKKECHCKFYLTGSKSDKHELDYIKSNLNERPGFFLNRKIPEVAAVISMSDLFITNDTGIMHVAGSTHTPQISIFGPTNPFNWAPLGAKKYFIRKSDLIDDVSVEDVLDLSKMLLAKGRG